MLGSGEYDCDLPIAGFCTGYGGGLVLTDIQEL